MIQNSWSIIIHDPKDTILNNSRKGWKLRRESIYNRRWCNTKDWKNNWPIFVKNNLPRKPTTFKIIYCTLSVFPQRLVTSHCFLYWSFKRAFLRNPDGNLLPPTAHNFTLETHLTLVGIVKPSLEIEHVLNLSMCSFKWLFSMSVLK